ncbi:MAG: hypothetical protein ACYCS2_00240 [Acidimicrobiales bacterium]
MANPIYCDATGCDAPADQMLSHIATGDVLAFCNEHFVGFCIKMAENAQAEMDAEMNGPAPAPEAQAGVATEGEPAEPAGKSPEAAEPDEDEATAGDEATPVAVSDD